MKSESKLAFVGGALSAIGRGLAAGRKFIPAAAGSAAQAVSKATPGAGRGMVQTALSDAKWGAGLGGLLDGTVAAATAAPGERGDAFLSGAARGAAVGGISGAASGAARQGMRNMRETHLGNMAGKQMAEQGMDPMARMTFAPMKGTEALNRPWSKDVAGSFTGKGPVGGAGSRFEALAAPATVMADMAVGGLAYDAADKVLPGGNGVPQHEVRQQPMYPPMNKRAQESTAMEMTPAPEESQYPKISLPPIAGSLAGGFVGNRGTEFALQKLEGTGSLHPTLSGKFMRGSMAPAIGALTAGLGYGAVKSMEPDKEEPPEIQALKGINLEALQRRYPAMPA